MSHTTRHQINLAVNIQITNVISSHKKVAKIKDRRPPLHYSSPTVKVSNSQMVLQPTYPYQSPLAKPPVMYEISSHIVYQKKF